MEKQLAFIQEDGYALASDKGIRDIEDHSASAILERDIGEYWRLRNSGVLSTDSTTGAVQEHRAGKGFRRICGSRPENTASSGLRC